MPGMRDIKRRIKSIQSTRKITRAMQLVSASKMRKAQAATLASRTYSSLAWELISNLSTTISPINPLLKIYPKAKKIGVVILSTNRGLVGSLNINLIPKLKETEQSNHPHLTSPLKGEEKEEIPSSSVPSPQGGGLGRGDTMEMITELITYGKKAKTIAVRLKKNIVADFPKIDKAISTEDIYPIVKFITEAYQTGQYSKIIILYNHFISTLVQKATIKQLLPFTDISNLSRPSATLPMLWGEENAESSPLQEGAPQKSKISGDPEELERSGGEVEDNISPYLFEPDPSAVFDHLLPRIIESQIYQAILEADASEHSARMVMMKNATEAAGDLIMDLTLTYNQLRQNKITTELAEITAGRIALE